MLTQPAFWAQPGKMEIKTWRLGLEKRGHSQRPKRVPERIIVRICLGIFQFIPENPTEDQLVDSLRGCEASVALSFLVEPLS